MRVKSSFIKNILAISFLSLLFLSCSPVTKASGSIIDETGNPLEGVQVEIKGKSAKADVFLTKSDGLYDFGEVEIMSHATPIEITLTVSKSGYKTISKQLSFGQENKDVIVLETKTD